MKSERRISKSSERIQGWEPPFMRPISRLGELTTPTTFSASTPERHMSDISELKSTVKAKIS